MEPLQAGGWWLDGWLAGWMAGWLDGCLDVLF